MQKKQMLAIDGVFLAVKCSTCGTVYDAGDGDYLAFFGSMTVGLEDVLVGVDPPRRPAKKAVSVVCRTPSCMAGLVKSMLGCQESGDQADPRWTQVLQIWAEDSGLDLVEAPRADAITLDAKTKLRAKKRA
jgi:hypothetical protein